MAILNGCYIILTLQVGYLS